MKVCLFVLLACLFMGCPAMLYRRDSDNVLKPDLLAISSTVLPMPYYSVYGYEKKLFRNKYKERPQGKISLVTKQPK